MGEGLDAADEDEIVLGDESHLRLVAGVVPIEALDESLAAGALLDVRSDHTILLKDLGLRHTAPYAQHTLEISLYHTRRILSIVTGVKSY